MLNIILVPRMGYMGCALAALASYFIMMITSYFVGRAKYPIPYPVGRILAYFGLAAVIFAAGMAVDTPLRAVNWAARAVLLVAYVAVIVRCEHIPLAAALKRLRR